MRIRPAALDDAEAIAPLLGELGYPCSTEEARERLGKLLGVAGIAVFVAEVEDALAGVEVVAELTALLHQPGRVAQITALVVGSSHRRVGAGKLLVEAAERWARDCGCARILVASAEHRHDAHAFYASIGYRHTSRRFTKDLAP
ncbi:MAG TPA: GNAT family N-acetyltransferase [Candidatus Polarisedimenticolaceae bacterium]